MLLNFFLEVDAVTEKLMKTNAPLRTWIVYHLNKGDIPGLELVKDSGFPPNTFKFPWVRMGGPGWEEKWSVIFVSCFITIE